MSVIGMLLSGVLRQQKSVELKKCKLKSRECAYLVPALTPCLPLSSIPVKWLTKDSLYKWDELKLYNIKHCVRTTKHATGGCRGKGGGGREDEKVGLAFSSEDYNDFDHTWVAL